MFSESIDHLERMQNTQFLVCCTGSPKDSIPFLTCTYDKFSTGGVWELNGVTQCIQIHQSTRLEFKEYNLEIRKHCLKASEIDCKIEANRHVVYHLYD